MKSVFRFRYVILVAAAVLLSLAATVLAPTFRVLLPVGVGYATKQMCSLIFVSGLSQTYAREAFIDPTVGPFGKGLQLKVWRDERRVEGGVFGLWRTHAVYRDGLGCTLHAAPDAFGVGEMAAPADALVQEIDASHRDAHFDAAALERAVTASFEEKWPGYSRRTLAVLVMHKGKIVAERYAEEIDPTTPLPGWSMAKSVTAILAGVLTRDGLIDIDAPGAVREWRATDDPRAAITLDHLLRMTSGLAVTEDQSGVDPNSRMLYLEDDAAAFAARRPLQTKVGARFEYMSGNTVLAMRRLQEALGGDAAVMQAYLRRELFEPLGMRSAVMEPDAAGTLIGGSFILATAQDWARFGALYAGGGRANGQMIITPDWIDYVTTPTKQHRHRTRVYGAGVWLRSPDAPPSNRPADQIYLSGWHGQKVYIFPTEDIVIVRLGATHGQTPDGVSWRTFLGVQALIDGVLAAYRSEQDG